MTRDVVNLEALDRTQVDRAGGKGARLGELSRIDGVRVPPGFCITTDAFQRVVSAAPTLHNLLDRLSRLRRDDSRPSTRSARRSAGPSRPSTSRTT